MTVNNVYLSASDIYSHTSDTLSPPINYNNDGLTSTQFGISNNQQLNRIELKIRELEQMLTIVLNSCRVSLYLL